jgi:flagellar basal-body rod protein FlgC
MDNSAGMTPESAGVRVAGVVETSAPPARIHEPGNPLADADGYIYMSNVNPVDELVNMISASRSYQNSVEVLSTSKELLLRTLSIGQ